MGFFQAVYAQDILLSTNQTDYYFKTGENAIIPIEINNTYGKQISGILQDTRSQLINQGNIQLSNYNTEKKSLSINEENNKISLDVGKSDTPSNFTVNLSFNYNENGNRIVPLGPIIIYFILEASPKIIPTSKIKCRVSQQPSTQSNQQDLFSQQQEQDGARIKRIIWQSIGSIFTTTGADGARIKRTAWESTKSITKSATTTSKQPIGPR